MEHASAKQTIFAAIAYGFIAGANTVLGLMYLIRRPSQLLGLAYLGVAVAFCGMAARHGRMV